VATDIVARGIDVTQISHVINYDMPDTIDAYTHRIGRTGRNTKTGDAFTFITSEDEDMVRRIEGVLRAKVKRCLLSGFDYKKAAVSRNIEFAWPVRQPQRRWEKKKTESSRERSKESKFIRHG
jgi:superfamily II DNA/RNA helicase